MTCNTTNAQFSCIFINRFVSLGQHNMCYFNIFTHSTKCCGFTCTDSTELVVNAGLSQLIGSQSSIKP